MSKGWGLSSSTGHTTYARLILMLWALLVSVSAQASLPVEQCGQGGTSLNTHLQVYVDQSAQKTSAEILQQPDSLWQAASPALLQPGFTRSAYWYRLSVTNLLAEDCELWLDLNTLHITDIQLYTRGAQHTTWQVQRAGAAYPFTQWAGSQREPSIPVTLAAHSDTQLMFRVSSEHALVLAPELLSQQVLIKKRMTSGLVDGVTYGMVGLLIILSVLIGYFFRFRALSYHALTVFFYTLYLSLVSGYAFVHLWPNAVFFNAQVIVVADIAMRIMTLIFLSELLQVKEQPSYSRWLMVSVQLGFVVFLGLRLADPGAHWLDYTGLLSSAIHLAAVLAIMLVLWTGWRQKLAYNGFAYWVALIVAAWFLQFLCFALGVTDIPPMEYSWLSVSAVPAALLLSYTLVNQLICLRHGEQEMQAELEQLKRAEQDALEQRVELRTEQLRNALRSQNMLLARISHDLRAPLQHVIRDAGLLQQSTQQAGRYGQSIQRAAHQQLELIDELLEYSRGELKQLELLVAPGYLFGFLDEIQDSGVFLAERNHNRFVSALADDLPLLVNADFRRLRQVIMNLLANAAKFTKQGLIELGVNLEHLDKQAGYADIMFSVSDNGIGIPLEERENLLEPFQRGAGSANYAGMGLGLYIVRQLLDSMSSKLEIKPSSSGGVCSYFTLRLELAGEQQLEQVYVESYHDNVEGQQHCVLIVDDVEIAQEMLYELLAGYNYSPIVCSSAAEAMVILREHPVDIIITDQVMPVMDGWDLLRKVRQECPGLPVLLYSARPPVRPSDLDSALEFDACLLKPATTSDLLAQLERLLEARVALSDG